MADPLVPDIIEACSAFFPELDNNDLAVTSTKLVGGRDFIFFRFASRGHRRLYQERVEHLSYSLFRRRSGIILPADDIFTRLVGS